MFYLVFVPGIVQCIRFPTDCVGETGILGVELQYGCLEWTDSFLIDHKQGIFAAL